MPYDKFGDIKNCIGDFGITINHAEYIDGWDIKNQQCETWQQRKVMLKMVDSIGIYYLRVHSI